MSSQNATKLNLVLLGSVVLLCVMGLFALWSYDGGDLRYFKRQIMFAGVGIAVVGAAILIPYRTSRYASYALWICGVAALAALLVFARAANGARGWFSLGPIKVQPAEFMKIFIVLSLARWLSYARSTAQWRGWVVPGLLALVPMGLIALQPDFGNAILIPPMLLAMMYVAGARTLHLAVILSALVVSAPLTFQFGLKPYQRDRLTSFLWPERVPKNLTYQQSQSEKACASGGLAGRAGSSQGQYAYHVPERHTDFVFSIIAEEFGFIGSSFLLLLYAAFFWQTGRIACTTREPYGRLVAVGLSTFLLLQVFINLGMTTGVAPITGLTLPFVSYGGSSLLTCCLAAGLLLNIGSRWIPTFSRHDLDAGHGAIKEFRLQGVR